MKLYFGNGVTTATTILLFVLLGFLGDSIWHRQNIVYWGRRTLFVLLFGLLICCFAAARDGLDKTIQHAIDGSCAPGLFPLVSVPTLIGCVGAALILIAAIATPITKSQGLREVWFLSRLCGRHAEDPDRRNLPAAHPLILTLYCETMTKTRVPTIGWVPVSLFYLLWQTGHQRLFLVIFLPAA